MKTTNLESDAFVFFGATGDLAYKQIFPALQAMIRRRHFDLPIIGVARSAKGLGPLRARARESLVKHGGVDPRAFAILSAKLQYVNGDYNSQQTFRDLRKALGGASRPLYYLAIPPNMFGTVVEGLAKADCDKGARVVVEKPFGRDLASARELDRILKNRKFFESIIISARKQSRICSTSALPTRFWSQSGTATMSGACKSLWPKPWE
jgi:glucose-6-phosphate 1-dehydrogenase